jgi:hypothetical protein
MPTKPDISSDSNTGRNFVNTNVNSRISTIEAKNEENPNFASESADDFILLSSTV